MYAVEEVDSNVLPFYILKCLTRAKATHVYEERVQQYHQETAICASVPRATQESTAKQVWTPCRYHTDNIFGHFLI